jgi:outer membrane protein assembly factor BamE
MKGHDRVRPIRLTFAALLGHIIDEIALRMQNKLIYLIAGAVFLIAGCTIHVPDVQQGNILDPAVLAQIHPGLSKKQVKYLLGTPIISDAFHPERWDYVYLFQSQESPAVRKRLTLFFDKDQVSRIETEGVTLPKGASPENPETDNPNNSPAPDAKTPAPPQPSP